MEVAEIEKQLTSHAAKEDIRHDFTFYTPSCRDVRVKVFIISKKLPSGHLYNYFKIAATG